MRTATHAYLHSIDIEADFRRFDEFVAANDSDKLSPARGLIIGAAASVILWAVIITLAARVL